VSKNWHSQDLVCSLPNLVAGQYYQKGARATPSRTGRGRPVLPRGSLLAPGPGSRPVLPKGSHCDSLQGGQGPAGTPERESAPSGTWQQAGTPEREPAQLPPAPGRGGEVLPRRSLLPLEPAGGQTHKRESADLRNRHTQLPPKMQIVHHLDHKVSCTHSRDLLWTKVCDALPDLQSSHRRHCRSS
jgi:hypothetical protein